MVFDKYSLEFDEDVNLANRGKSIFLEMANIMIKERVFPLVYFQCTDKQLISHFRRASRLFKI